MNSILKPTGPSNTLSVGINRFVRRQLASDFEGTKLTEATLLDLCGDVEHQLNEGINVQEGYAPFCKIVVIENQGYDILASYIHEDDLPLSYDIYPAGYKSRQEGEPAMPTTPTVELMGDLPQATHLHCVIYTREQLEAEESDPTGCDWDLISVNAEMGMEGAPMTPTTMIRNHLGKEFGGSGKPIDLEKYNKAVEFWSKHYLVK